MAIYRKFFNFNKPIGVHHYAIGVSVANVTCKRVAIEETLEQAIKDVCKHHNVANYEFYTLARLAKLLHQNCIKYQPEITCIRLGANTGGYVEYKR